MNRDLSQLSGEELKNAVQSIVSDPAFGKLLGELQGNREEGKTTPVQPPAITPEIMAKLPDMMRALAPMVSGAASGSPGGEGSKANGGKSDAEKRKRLLSALKPYLSATRRDAVDGLLRVTEMTDMLGNLGSLSDVLKPKPGT